MASFQSARGNKVETMTTTEVLFSDDFGGAAVDVSKWDVIDGGLGLNPNLGYGALTQAAIGSGITGITDSVSASALTVSMGTTANAERWYLSKTAFAGKEDILAVLSKSQAVTQNSIFIGLVEIDPTTGIPLLNPNLAADFTNRGGCEFGLTVANTAVQAEAVADSSPAKSVGNVPVLAALTTMAEYLIEIDSRDVMASQKVIDATNGNLAAISRVSSQCPNDTKLYKLLMRFQNVGTPTATSVVIRRVLVNDAYEFRVQIATGEGDLTSAKGVAVNVAANNLAGNVLALNANPTASGNAAAKAAVADLMGRTVVQPGGFPQAHDFGSALSLATTSETTLIAAAASNRHMLQALDIVNNDTVAHTYSFRETTAGTVRFKVKVAAGDSKHLEWPAGVPAAAVNTNWTIQMGESQTTNPSDIYSSSYRTTA